MSKEQVAFIPWRFYLLISIIILSVVGLGWRVFDLAIIDQHFLRQQGDERVLRAINTPAFRGMIVDRNGYPLAISTMVYSIWMNPHEFLGEPKSLSVLSTLLQISDKKILATLNHYKNGNREFIYLKRGLSPEINQQIKSLNIRGIYTQEEYRRYYPEGEVTAHVIGFTNIDDRGQEGLELGYNQWLQGEHGKKWVIKDRLGRIISDVRKIKDQKAGNNLVLSIDKRIQYLAYRELLIGITANHAISGSALVLDPQTGEVLAMVNYPSFNPNNRQKTKLAGVRNRAVTDTFEPGSTIKAFTVASALESGLYTPNSIIDTSPGWMRVDRNLVRDERNNGRLTMAQILQISSNMGTAKIVLTLPPNQLWSLLHRVGFGELTGIGFPGEQNGVLVNHQRSFMLATLSFGYSMSVTALQLARAYCIFANNGIKMPVSLIKIDKSPPGERVLASKLAREMLAVLEITKTGTGRSAHVPGYRVAGKTGTVNMVGKGGYQKHRYTSSFVGIAPVSNPRLVVAVVIHDPQGKPHTGGQVSGPIFERIMEGALRILDVSPDAV